MNTKDKIAKILAFDYQVWQTMDKQALIDQLSAMRQEFLETEVWQGNEEYLDEILEDVDSQSK